MVLRVLFLVLGSLSLLATDGNAQDAPSIAISEPADFSTLVINPPAEVLNNLLIQFSVSNPSDELKLCVLISAFGTPLNKSERCLSSKSDHITLSGLKPGFYTFQFILKQEELGQVKYVFESMEAVRVAVITIDDAVPEFDFSQAGELFYINNNEDNVPMDISLELQIASSMLFEYLNLCVEVVNIDEEKFSTISLVCTPLKGTPQNGAALSFTLPSLPLGNYSATLSLQNALSNKILPLKKTKNFRVVPRIATLPDILLPLSPADQVIGHEEDVVPASVPFELHIKDSGILQADNVEVCGRVLRDSSRDDDSNVHFPACISVYDQNSLQLAMLSKGMHRFELILKDRGNLVNQSRVQGSLDIRTPEEFVPSFDWQPLRAWHTAPKGLEIRLPVGGSGSKEARVPEPWRLQLSMPHPCKFFLRLDTYRRTTMDYIRAEAAKKCDVSSHCLFIEADGVVIEDHETVLSSQIYQKKVSLEFNSTCLDAFEEEDEDFEFIAAM